MVSPPGMYGDIKLLAGTASPELTDEISVYLSEQTGKNVPILKRQIKKFSNDNTFVRLSESVRGQDVYIIQTMDRPVNDNIMELLITLDAVRRDSAGRITAVVPYMAYARSDKKDLPRTPITARLIADMIEVAGADRFMTIDLHSGQIQGFFRIPGDALTAMHLLSDYISEALPLDDLTVTTVDLGFAKEGRKWASTLGVPMALIEKSRKDEGVQARNVVGNVKDRNILLVDDELNTGGSMREAVQLLDREGAKEITIAFTHPVFSGEAVDNLKVMHKRVREFVFTNTIPISDEERMEKMTVISVKQLLGEVILRAHEGRSVGEMFNE